MKCPYCEETIDHVIVEFLKFGAFKTKEGKALRLMNGRAFLCPKCDNMLPVDISK
ncbi:MAG: hypothetical protein ACFFDI_33020 [Promethearchaeota archaeon]